jgi:hypothetical protein
MANDLSNQRVDNVTLVLNRMWKVDPQRVPDNLRLVSAPGAIWRTLPGSGVSDSLEAIDTPDVTRSAYQEVAMLKQMFEEATGVTEPMRGTPTSRRETATAMSLMADASLQRFGLKLSGIAEGVRDLAELFYAMDLQFLDRKQAVRILGAEGWKFAQMDKDDIRGQFDITVRATAALANKLQTRQQWLQLYQLTATDPNANRVEFLYEILESFGVKDKERFVLRPPVIPPAEHVRNAQIENQMMLQWQPVQAGMGDDHMIHIAIHSQLMSQAPAPEIGQAAAVHIQEHQMMAQQAQASAGGQPQQQQQMMIGAPGAGQAAGTEAMGEPKEGEINPWNSPTG